jgi:voltage-gated potassium channel
MRLKKRVQEILDVAAADDIASRFFDVFLVALIAINVAALMLETVRPLYDRAPGLFRTLESFSVAVFTVEYLLRLWSVTEKPRYRHPLGGRLRFALTPLALCDLLAVLPFYLPFVGVDLRFARSVRLLRFFRIVKLGRYSVALQTFARVMTRKRAELVTILILLSLLLIFASSLMYYAENAVQPDQFSSIPAAMWWGMVTLTTVGYGDVYPVTGIGRLLGMAIAVLGIGMFALPAGILGAAFVEELQAKGSAAVCPHCGRKIGDQRLED